MQTQKIIIAALLQATQSFAQHAPTVKPQIAPGEVIKKGKLVYSEININASAEKVWSVLTNFQDYPTWNPFIRSISGPLVKGGHLTAFLQPEGEKGMTFKPLVLQCMPQKELRWIGKLGISHIFDGEHTFNITENGNGTVTFRQYEHFRGILIPFFKKMLDKGTLQGFNNMNEKLKERAEKKN